MRNRTSTKKKKNVNGKSEIKIIKKHRVIDKVQMFTDIITSAGHFHKQQTRLLSRGQGRKRPRGLITIKVLQYTLSFLFLFFFHLIPLITFLLDLRLHLLFLLHLLLVFNILTISNVLLAVKNDVLMVLQLLACTIGYHCLSSREQA